MATVSPGQRTRKRITPEAQQRADRVALKAAELLDGINADRLARANRKAAAAELARNGIAVPKDDDQREQPQPVRRVSEFVSAPDAVEIPKAEICNFDPLTTRDARILARAMEAADEEPWGDGWSQHDYRWKITPHALRKQREREIRMRVTNK